MARQDSSGRDKNRRSGDTKIGLTLRVVVAVYVLYLAYGLIQGFGETSGNDRIFIAIAIIVFIAAGGAILFFSGGKLIRKEYLDAEEDAEDENAEAETEIAEAEIETVEAKIGSVEEKEDKEQSGDTGDIVS